MRLLIVEDQPKIANALKRGLTQEGYAVDVAYDGDSGLAFALDEDYDLLILDRMLPGSFDGLDICKKMREAQKTVPILLLTAKDKTADKVDGLDAGADDYLVKPFALEELLARIRSLLRRPSQFVGETLQLADLTLNAQTFKVARGSQSVILTSKEFAILECLLRNKDRVLTKDAIIAHVWDYDADILPNTLEVYIGYLRVKIDKAFPEKPPLIKTVRGFGYKASDV